MILKMNNIFNIDELIKHILSFIPRHLIGPCIFVNKQFYKSIPIIYDQEQVARTGDLFSLSKIPYSLRAVIIFAREYAIKEIQKDYKEDENQNGIFGMISNMFFPKPVITRSQKYGSVKLLEWLFDNKYKDIKKLGTVKYDLAGFLGNKKFERDIMDLILVGLCQGLHFDLIEKFKNDFRIWSTSGARIMLIVFRMDEKIKQKIFSILNVNENILEYRTIFNCANKDPKHVLSFIEKFTNENIMDKNKITEICHGLIIGNHYDIFLWFTSKYEYKNNDYITDFIVNDNFEFFSYYMRNNWNRERYYDRLLQLTKQTIQFKRTKMTLFLIQNFDYTLINYLDLLEEAQKLELYDVMVAITEKYRMSEKIDI